MSDREEKEDQISDDGTEGSTVGYMKAGQLESAESEEKPEKEEVADEDTDEDEGDPKEGDEEESEDEDEEPDELEKARQELQTLYGTKFRELSKKKGLVQLAERIQENPEEMIPWLAEKYGIEFGPKKESKSDDVKIDAVDLSNIQPGENETMPAYIQRVFAEGFKGLMSQLPDVVSSSVKGALPKNKPGPKHKSDDSEETIGEALAYLDSKHKDWAIYEDDMVAALKEKPELINDPEKLYQAGKEKSGLASKRAKVKSKKVGKKIKFSTTIRGTGKRNISQKGKPMDWNTAWSQAKKDAIRRK